MEKYFHYPIASFAYCSILKSMVRHGAGPEERGKTMNSNLKPIEEQLKVMYGDMYNYWRVFATEFDEHIPNPDIVPASGWFDMVEPIDEEETFRFGWHSCYQYMYYTVQGQGIDDVNEVMRFSENPPLQYYGWSPVCGW
jgi:hypothetical protein